MHRLSRFFFSAGLFVFVSSGCLLADETFTLYDPGTEFPVDYERYGEFSGVGTKDYSYRITERAMLGKAVGQGIFPYSGKMREDPAFKKMDSEGRLKGRTWDYNDSDDYQAAFFKWVTAKDIKLPGLKLYFSGLALEKAGLIEHALKAYYALVVHFPNTTDWTFFHTPWYPGRVALDRIYFLCRKYPELGFTLEGARINVINGYDNDVRNDVFIVDPGRFVKRSASSSKRGLAEEDILEQKGKNGVRLIRYSSGDWQLRVQGRPYTVKGVAYFPSRIGQSPSDGSLVVHRDWMINDFNKNGRADGPFDSWVDKNSNNVRDADEGPVGDFRLLQDMGANTIRLYHHGYSKDLLERGYRENGLMYLMGDYLGAYAIGSGASWDEGTDYTNPFHRKNMMVSIKEMLDEYKEEPYILMWVLGNENNIAPACNAGQAPDAYYRFCNEAARFIKENDPYGRPVLLCNGDVLFLDIFSDLCPDIDVYGANTYRGKDGFGMSFWQDIRDACGKPVLITEYGCPAYADKRSQEEAQAWQSEYHRGCWLDIEGNLAGSGVGNCLGGVVFEWTDEWWKASGTDPRRHDKKGEFRGPFLDGWLYEEWLGITGQGDGSDSPFMRVLRPAYFMYRGLWKERER